MSFIYSLTSFCLSKAGNILANTNSCFSLLLGLSHGLVLLPVILSLMGPMGQPVRSGVSTVGKSGDSVVSETQRVYERVEL